LKRLLAHLALVAGLYSQSSYNLEYLLTSKSDTIGVVKYDNRSDTSFLDINISFYLLNMFPYNKRIVFRAAENFYEEIEASGSKIYAVNGYTIVSAIPAYLEEIITEEVELPFFGKEYLIMLEKNNFKVFYNGENVWVEQGYLNKQENKVVDGIVKLDLPWHYKLLFPEEIGLFLKD